MFLHKYISLCIYETFYKFIHTHTTYSNIYLLYRNIRDKNLMSLSCCSSIVSHGIISENLSLDS